MFYDLTTKIDMHVHTMEGSPDAKIPARELVRLYKEAGYGAIVITEHVCENSPKLPMEERIEKWTSGYREAKDEGDKIGVQVFLGAEVRLERAGGEDYLVYGLEMENVEWLMRTLDSAQTIAELSEAVRVNGFFFAQAHPFRGECRVQEPELLDGVEAFNGKPRGLPNNNHLAFDFAVANDLVMISGSDTHQPIDIAHGGLKMPREIETSRQFCDWLKAGSLRSHVNFSRRVIMNLNA